MSLKHYFTKLTKADLCCKDDRMTANSSGCTSTQAPSHHPSCDHLHPPLLAPGNQTRARHDAFYHLLWTKATAWQGCSIFKSNWLCTTPSAHATCFSDLQQDESLVQETRLVFSHPPAEGFQVSPTIPTFLTAVRSTWQPF